MRRDKEVQMGSYKTVGGVKYSTGNIVIRIVITMYSARWFLDLQGGHFVS